MPWWMGKVLSVNIIWIIKNDRWNRPLPWPSLCSLSDAEEMLIAVNHAPSEGWEILPALNSDPRCWSEIDNNLEIPAEFKPAGCRAQGHLPKRSVSPWLLGPYPRWYGFTSNQIKWGEGSVKRNRLIHHCDFSQQSAFFTSHSIYFLVLICFNL